MDQTPIISGFEDGVEEHVGQIREEVVATIQSPLHIKPKDTSRQLFPQNTSSDEVCTVTRAICVYITYNLRLPLATG